MREFSISDCLGGEILNNEKITLEQIELLKSKTKITAEHLKPYIKMPNYTDEIKTAILALYSKFNNISDIIAAYESMIEKEIDIVNSGFANENYCKAAYDKIKSLIKDTLFFEWIKNIPKDEFENTVNNYVNRKLNELGAQ